METSLPRKYTWLDGLFILLLVLDALLLAWGLNRGFEIKDEAFALLNYRWPLEYHFGSFFHHITNRLFGWLHPDIMTYRVLTIILKALSIGVFVKGFQTWIQTATGPERAGRWFLRAPFLFCLFTLADWFVFTRYQPTLTYHMLNPACLNLATGFLLWFLGRNLNSRNSAGQHYALLSLAGFFAGVDLFIKFSTSVALFGVLAMAILFHGVHFRSFRPIKALLYFVGGYLGSMLVFFATIMGVSEWWSEMVKGASHEAGAGHKPLKVINKYLSGYIKILKLTFRTYLLPLLLMLGALIALRRPIKQAASIRMIILAAALGCIAWVCWNQDHFWGMPVFFWLMSLALLATRLAEANDDTASRPSWRYLTGMSVFLGLLNFVGIFGSNTGVGSSFFGYVTPPAAGLITLIAMLNARHLQNLFAGFLMLALQFAWGRMYALDANRYVESRVLQTTPVQGVPSLRGIQLDPEKARFFQELYGTVNAARKSNEPPVILVLFSMPGIVYALDGYPAEARYVPWTYFTEHEVEPYCALLNQFEADRNRHQWSREWFALVQENIPDEAAPCTARYLKNYQPLKTLSNPLNRQQLTVYALKTGSK